MESEKHKLNILNLATEDTWGAGIASVYYNELFNKAGHNSWLFVKQSRSSLNHVLKIEKAHTNIFIQLYIKIINRLSRIKTKHFFDPKYFFFNIDESKEYINTKEILDALTFKPDVIILHWISTFVNSKTINELVNATKAKIVWLMLDNAPLTGGCHFPWDCKGFHTDCSNCPAILISSKKKIAINNLALKKEFLPNSLEIITCSEFDFIKAKKASLFINKPIHKILIPVNEKKYKPADKTKAKHFFNIDANKKVIFYGTIKLNNIRKGGSYFLNAISILQKELKQEGRSLDEWFILVAGSDLKDAKNQIEIPLIEVGFLSEDNLIKAYQAADVFISTSIEDSGPLMINQSIMCATPVVSFAMGVALDLVITGETGYRAKLKDTFDLAKGVKYVLELNDMEYMKLSGKCRNIGLELCKSEEQVAKLVEIFKN